LPVRLTLTGFLPLMHQGLECGGDAAEFMGQLVGAARPDTAGAENAVKRIDQSNDANKPENTEEKPSGG
jgi:hypothetical protein